MTRNRIAGLALTTLLLAAGALVAQPAEDGSATPAVTEPPEQTGPADRATGADAATAGSAGATRSPSDYRSSEEISEDLPVSFPVDI